MRNPINKKYLVTSMYGWRMLGGSRDFHNGIDLVPTDAKHPCEIVAAADGIVVDVRSSVLDSHTGLGVTTMVTGNYVNIRTKEGYTLICRHLKEKSVTAKLGDKVKEGDKIGVMGTTGQSTGIHLHYEIRDANWQSIDPAPYLENDAKLPSAAVSTPSPVNYDVRVNADATPHLNIRSGAGTNFPRLSEKDVLLPGAVITVVEESAGTGAKLWGRLNDGKGWISLDYTTKVSASSATAPPVTEL